MERQDIAYLLIAGLVLAVAAWIVYARYNTRKRKDRCRNVREKAAHEKRMADRL